MSKKPTVCGVQVHTWGTTHHGNGVWSYLKSNLYGGNIGHTSMTLTVPDNEESKRLIEQYCYNYDEDIENIPYRKRKINFSDGSHEKVYEIYFSAWPSTDPSVPFVLEDDIDNDNLGFLYGEDFNWNERFKDPRNEYEKIITGKLAKRKVSRGPLTIGHYGNKELFGNDEKKILSILSRNVKLNNDLKSLKTLKKKLKSSGSKKLFINSDSNKLLIKNIFGYNNKKMDEFLTKRVLSSEDVERLKSISEGRIKWCKSNIASNERKIKQTFPKKSAVDNIKKYLSLGTSASGLVSLPINNTIEPNIGFYNGLDVEEMLIHMHDLVADNIKFNLYDKNCSELVSNILASGISQQHLKSVVTERTFFGIHNPQTVYNASIKVKQGIINNEKTNVWYKLKVFNPSSYIEKIIVKLILYQNYHYYLTPVIVFAIVVLVLPVLILRTIFLPVNLFGAFVAEVISKTSMVKRSEVYTKKMLSEDKEEIETEKKLKSDKDQELKNYIEPKIIKINSSASFDAILGFAEALTFPELIPVFSNESLKGIKKYVKKHHNTTPDDLIVSIKKLKLSLLEDLDYKDLNSLINELKLLSANRVTGSVKELHDVLEHNKTIHAIHYNTKMNGSKKDYDENAVNNNPNIKPDL